jgi:hypothetical protein
MCNENLSSNSPIVWYYIITCTNDESTDLCETTCQGKQQLILRPLPFTEFSVRKSCLNPPQILMQSPAKSEFDLLD